VLLRFGGVVFIVLLALWLYCLLDAITSDADRVRALPKAAWVLILLVTFEFGAILWLVLGRPRSAPSAPQDERRRGPDRQVGRDAQWPGWRRHPSAMGRAGRPAAPDDDPEFLARLDRQVSAEQERMLGRWEEDLRRREEELRRRETGEDEEPRPDDSAR
jgi:Phospholipase_D-nuclease N-terminal